jgi:dehydrogenase/reductase SDR family protein 1
MTKKPLTGKIALVTGATRGIGKGVALQLGEAGCTVYITGRTLKAKEGSLGSLEETANEIRDRGGKCVACEVDHENDAQIAKLFEQIDTENNGRLDILVNNAYKGVNTIFENSSLKFWEVKPEIWDDINNVGLRNHYFCTVYAARLMTARKQGLIVNISSFGGIRYLFNVAYGIGKAAVDRMAVDCGIELRKSNVTMLSLYPGAVKTELVTDIIKNQKTETQTDLQNGKKVSLSDVFEKGESIEFSGKIIVDMAQDPNIIKLTSRVIIGAEYARSKGIRDIDNREIMSFRQVKGLIAMYSPKNFQFLSAFVPAFVKIPQFLLDILNSKF